MAYAEFAAYYDAFTTNVAYQERAQYFDRLIRQNQDQTGILLDLACGTGSLTAELLRLGYEVIGVDGSAEMLSIATSKAPATLFLCQQMQELDLYGTIDVTICALDSLNHVTSLAELRRVFARVALFTAPDGLFLFDVNTEYKQREILSDNTFFYETEGCCCVWQNRYDVEQRITEIDLDFFIQEGDRYRRESEQFTERAYTRDELDAVISSAGLETVAVYGDDTLEPPTAITERLIYVTRKLPLDRGGIAGNNHKIRMKVRRK